MKKSTKNYANFLLPSNTAENESRGVSPKTIIAFIVAAVALVVFGQFKYDFFPMVGFAVLFAGIIQLIQFLIIYAIRKEIKSALGIGETTEVTVRSPRDIILRSLLKLLLWFVKFELYYLGTVILSLLGLAIFSVYPAEEEFIKIAAGAFLCAIGFLLLGFRSDLAGIIYNFKSVKELSKYSLYIALILSFALVLSMKYAGYNFDLNPTLVQLPILPFGYLIYLFQKNS